MSETKLSGKRCSLCGGYKPRADYLPSKLRPDRVQPACRPCQEFWHLVNVASDGSVPFLNK